MWTDEYKAPWYRNMYNFRKADLETNISYLHSLVPNMDLKIASIRSRIWAKLMVILINILAKFLTISYRNNTLKTSYQFYGAKEIKSPEGELTMFMMVWHGYKHSL